MHTNWRDCDAWRKQNLPVNTVSNEAAKFYDASLTQFVSYCDSSLIPGGLMSSLQKAVAADPTFILGRCLKHGVNILGSSAHLEDEATAVEINSLKELTVTMESDLTKREIMHVKAVDRLAKGDLPAACNIWEQIIQENPTDMHAIQMSQSSYFYLGAKEELRDGIARVLPIWEKNKSLPLFNFLYGKYAFGLSQTNLFQKAQEMARIGLDLCKQDAWAVHACCHVYEYTSQADKGIRMLNSTEYDWQVCNWIASHNYWHLGLFHLEKNETDEVVKVLNKYLMSSDDFFDLVNASSLLYRMKLDDYQDDKGLMRSKWKTLREKTSSSKYHHGYLFGDMHISLVLSSAGDKNDRQAYLASIGEYLNTSEFETSIDEDELTVTNTIKTNEAAVNYLKQVNKELADPVINSIFYYDDGDYDKVVELLYPVRRKLFKLGGSNAQLDLFGLILVNAALKSTVNHQLGVALLNERRCFSPERNINKRLAARFALE